jgi:hypothetical protein
LKPFVDVENHHFPRIPKDFLFQRSVTEGEIVSRKGSKLMPFEVEEVGGRATNVVPMFRVSVALSNNLHAGGIRNEGRRIEISKRGRKQDHRNE